MGQMIGFNELREQDTMTWTQQERGWVAAPEDIVDALSNDGFEECKREMATSRRDRRPAGGLVFIEVDGEAFTGGAARANA